MRYCKLPIASLMYITFLISVLTASTTYDGYTFVFAGKKAYLYDMDKTVVHTWTCPYNIEGCADLLRDSSIVVPSVSKSTSISKALSQMPLSGGRIQIINWNGEITWDYIYSAPDYIPHHDIEPVYRTNDPDEKPTFLLVCATEWGDKITEIRPTGKTTGEVIWEWKGSDHSCESNCTDKIEVLDKAFGGISSMNKTADIMHTNNVSFNRVLDQLVVSVKGFNEMIVIDHSTTTAQAAGTTGGKYGKGGQILYRWGSSKNYGASSTTQQFKGQHHCCWVQDTLIGTSDTIPGGGNFMAIDNGNKRAVEIACPGAKDGIYTRTAGQAFGPETHLWQYKPSGLQNNEGSIQKMPNGNYIIGTGGLEMGFGGGDGGGFFASNCKVYEVSSSGTVLWELDVSDIGNSTEAYRYAYGYLDHNKTGTAAKNRGSSAVPFKSATIKTTNSGSSILVSINTIMQHPARLSLFSLSGKEMVKSALPSNNGIWNLGAIQAGTYLVRIISGNDLLTSRITIQQ